MADLNIANLTATLSVKASAETKAAADYLEAVAQAARDAETAFQLSAAGYEAAQKKLAGFGVSAENAKQQLSQITAEFERLGGQQSVLYEGSASAAAQFQEANMGLAMSLVEVIETRDDFIKNSDKLEAALRKLAKASSGDMDGTGVGPTEKITKMFSPSAANAVSQYSRSMARLFSLFSSGQGATTALDMAVSALTKGLGALAGRIGGGGLEAAKGAIGGLVKNLFTLKNAIGGLVTVGIAGAIFAFTQWIKHKQKMTSLLKEAIGLLRNEGDALTKNAQAWVREKMMIDEDLDALNSLGMSTEQFTRAAMGGDEARRNLKEQMIEMAHASGVVGKELNDLLHKIDEIGISMEKAEIAAKAYDESLRISAETGELARMQNQVDAMARAFGVSATAAADLMNHLARGPALIDDIRAAQNASYSAEDQLIRIVRQLEDIERQKEALMRAGEYKGQEKLELNLQQAQLERQAYNLLVENPGLEDLVQLNQRMLEITQDNTLETYEWQREMGKVKVTAEDILEAHGKWADLNAQTAFNAARQAEMADQVRRATSGYGAMDTSGLPVTDWEQYGERVLEAFTGIEPGMLEAGINAYNGFAQPFKDLGAEARTWAQSVEDAFHEVFQDRSPSKTFIKIGKNVADGLNLGIASGLTGMSKVISDAVSAAQAAISFELSLYAVEDAKDALRDVRLELELMEKLRAQSEGSALSPQSEIDVRNASRDLAMAKAARAAGLASDADVTIAEWNAKKAKASARTLDEAVSDLQIEVRKAELAFASASLNVVSGYLAMAAAGKEMTAAGREAFMTLADDLGLPKEALDAITAAWGSATDAAETGITAISGGGGGGGLSEAVEEAKKQVREWAEFLAKIDPGSKMYDKFKEQIDAAKAYLEEIKLEEGLEAFKEEWGDMADEILTMFGTPADLEGLQAIIDLLEQLDETQRATWNWWATHPYLWLPGQNPQTTRPYNPNAPGIGPAHLAEGGFLGAGQPSIVGETGRELFLPKTSGLVIPANLTRAILAGNRSGGGGNTVINDITIDIQASWPVEDMEARKIATRIREALRVLELEA